MGRQQEDAHRPGGYKGREGAPGLEVLACAVLEVSCRARISGARTRSDGPTTSGDRVAGRPFACTDLRASRGLALGLCTVATGVVCGELVAFDSGGAHVASHAKL